MHLECSPGVILLLLRPLAVLFVEGVPVVVDILIDLDVTNLEGGEALVKALLDNVSEVVDYVEKNESDQHGPLDTIPAFACEDASHSVARDVRVGGLVNLGKEVVAEELLAGSHPVAKADVQEGSKLELLEDIVAETLIVHGWGDVTVEEHELLDDVEDEEGEHGDGEQDGHTETIHERDVCDGED